MHTQPTACLSLVWIACLQGCATIPADVGVSFKPGLGCFVVSWGDEAASGNPLSSRSSYAYFRRVGSQEFGSIGYSAGSLQALENGYPFVEGEAKGLVHVRFVPPGKYQVDSFSFHFRSFMTPMAFQASDRRQPVVIPFDVESGKCTYLGRLLTRQEENSFYWIDRNSEDMSVAKRALPSEFQRTTSAAVSLQTIPVVLRTK